MIMVKNRALAKLPTAVGYQALCSSQLCAVTGNAAATAALDNPGIYRETNGLVSFLFPTNN